MAHFFSCSIKSSQSWKSKQNLSWFLEWMKVEKLSVSWQCTAQHWAVSLNFYSSISPKNKETLLLYDKQPCSHGRSDRSDFGELLVTVILGQTKFLIIHNENFKFWYIFVKKMKNKLFKILRIWLLQFLDENYLFSIL